MKLVEPSAYIPHPLHGANRLWPETNCYVDLCIEILASYDLEPRAMLGFALAVDFEGSQWTFFKPSHEHLHRLYGLRIEELTIWRGLRIDAEDQIRRGRIVLPEVDAFYLPDTSATDYRRSHTKTTIGIVRLDESSCDYFHNGGFYQVSGEDLAGLFAARELPLFCEYVKTDGLVRREHGDLRQLGLEALRASRTLRPRENPFGSFARHLRDDGVTAHGLAYWHKYAFASVRQCGAAFELAAEHLRWLDAGLDQAAAHCTAIATHAKALVLKGARAANAGRVLDAGEAMMAMAEAWRLAMNELEAHQL